MLVSAYRCLMALALPERHMVNRFIARSLAAAAADGRCLDIGAGTAPFASALAAALPGLEYVAIDRIANDTTDVIADATTLPFEKDSAALACFFQVLSHLPSPVAALREAGRVLRPDGLLLVTYPLLCPQGRSMDLWRWTRAGMEALLDEADFVVIDHRPQGGILSYFVATLAMVPGRLLIPHRAGWRSGRDVVDAARLALATALALPFHLLGFPAWFLDRIIDRNPAFYIGAMVLARPRGGAEGAAECSN